MGGLMLLILGSIGKNSDKPRRQPLCSISHWVPWGQQLIPSLQQAALVKGQQPVPQQVIPCWQQLNPSLQQTALGIGQQL